jgi:hypothetical protein
MGKGEIMADSTGPHLPGPVSMCRACFVRRHIEGPVRVIRVGFTMSTICPFISQDRTFVSATLRGAINVASVRAHAWIRLLSDGTHMTVESLAQSVGVHPKIVRSRIRMAFLAPTITKAILEGDQASSSLSLSLSNDVPRHCGTP